MHSYDALPDGVAQVDEFPTRRNEDGDSASARTAGREGRTYGVGPAGLMAHRSGSDRSVSPIRNTHDLWFVVLTK